MANAKNQTADAPETVSEENVAPLPNGHDALGAADTIIRESQRWEGLRAVAARLKATGSLEAAATAAEMRRSNAMGQLAEVNERIAEAMAELSAKTDHAGSIINNANTEAAGIVDAAKREVEVASTRALGIIEDAKSQATRIVGVAQLEGEAFIEKIKNDNSQAIAAYEAKQQQLKAMDADIEKRQATLNDINARLSNILGNTGA